MEARITLRIIEKKLFKVVINLCPQNLREEKQVEALYESLVNKSIKADTKIGLTFLLFFDDIIGEEEIKKNVTDLVKQSGINVSLHWFPFF